VNPCLRVVDTRPDAVPVSVDCFELFGSICARRVQGLRERIDRERFLLRLRP
jgi:hypothetical protein